MNRLVIDDICDIHVYEKVSDKYNTRYVMFMESGTGISRRVLTMNGILKYSKHNFTNETYCQIECFFASVVI